MQLLETPVTLGLLIVTILTSYRAFTDYELKSKFLFNPYRAKNNGEWYRVLSHSLIHADMMHLAFNMIGLFSFGMLVEEYFVLKWGAVDGRIKFALLYIGAVIFATLPAFKKHSENPYYNSLGASGGVSAILIAAALVCPQCQFYFMFIIKTPAWIAAIIFFFIEFQMNKRNGTNIAHDAHLAGAIYGLALLALLDYRILINFIKYIGGIIGLA